MKTPTSAEILDLLISLYAEQEGVVIKYELEMVTATPDKNSRSKAVEKLFVPTKEGAA